MKKVYYIVKLGLFRITPYLLLAKGRNMVSKMTANPLFATPTPKLVDVTAACDKLEAANDAYVANRGPRERADRLQCFNDLKALLLDLVGYVQAVSNGDLEVITSAGLEVRKRPAPIGELDAPSDLLASTTAYPGRIDVGWSAVKGRLMYELEICNNDPSIEANWKLLTLTSRNRHKAENLTSNEEYFFRVKAIGSAGVSPVSEVTNAKAA